MKKTNSNKPQEAASDAPQMTPEVKEAKPIKFVVVRDGYRVSDRDYETADDPTAINECEFWSRIANNHSHGESVAIVQYDSKRHRVW